MNPEPRTLDAAGLTWESLEAADGPQTLVVLPGALGVAAASAATVTRLAAGRRVLAPTYPASLSTMSALADGLDAWLDALGVAQAALFGASYGGLVAQALARRHPARFDALILSHTGAPMPDRAARLERALRLLRWLPGLTLRGMLSRQFAKTYAGIPGEAAAAAQEGMQRIVAGLEKRAILNGYARVAEFDRAWEAQPGAPYGGRTLLIFGAEDDATPPEARAQLAALYPQAEVMVFEGSGHATALTDPEGYFAVVEEFLRAAPPAAS